MDNYMEKAREIANRRWLDTFEKTALAKDIATALREAHANGKAEARREERLRRAGKNPYSAILAEAEKGR